MEQNFVVANVYSSQMEDGYYDGYVRVSTDDSKLLKLVVENPTASTRWVQVYEGTNSPLEAGDVPVLSLKLLTVTQQTFDASEIKGLYCKGGITIAVSSTGPTYTAVTGAADEGAFITAIWI